MTEPVGQQIQLTDLKPIQSTFDTDEYIGKRVKIEKANIDYNITNGYYLKVETAVLTTIPILDNVSGIDCGTKEIRASRLFSLKTDKEGVTGWTPKSNLAKFLAKHRLTNINELIGLTVTIDRRVTGTGEFLTFN